MHKNTYIIVELVCNTAWQDVEKMANYTLLSVGYTNHTKHARVLYWDLHQQCCGCCSSCSNPAGSLLKFPVRYSYTFGILICISKVLFLSIISPSVRRIHWHAVMQILSNKSYTSLILKQSRLELLFTLKLLFTLIYQNKQLWMQHLVSFNTFNFNWLYIVWEVIICSDIEVD